MKNEIPQKLLKWYSVNKRTFPWRDHPDPYAVWVSEVMAQQTRLETVLPYFRDWMARFPSVVALAAANQQDVLAVWEGLGYYSRARNLHQAAQIVAREYNGILPRTAAELKKLPGIGRYTAGAIASIAFGADEAVVDGNVKRVLARLFSIEEAVNSTSGEKLVWELAGELIPPGQAGDFNQALMDLGAMVCLPRQPDCANCPLAEQCGAYRTGRQEDFPVKTRRESIPHHTVTAAVIRKGNSVLIAQRPENALLGGLWEFPGGKQEDHESLESCLKREIKEELGVTIEVGAKLGVYRHAYTHYKVTLHAFETVMKDKRLRLVDHQDAAWVAVDRLGDYPMGKLDRQISQTLQARGTSDEPEVPTAD